MQMIKHPVSKGQQVKLDIEGLSHDGAGVGRKNRFTVFVPDTAPGDKVTARVVSVQKNHARALVESVDRPSPLRVNPSCSYYNRCGGCQLQHIDYASQIRLKQEVVTETLQRIGGLKVSALPVIGMDNPWYYRNKAQVPVGSDGEKVIAGFYEKRSHNIVDIDTCLIQHPANNRVVSAVREKLRELKVPPYNERKHTGIVRHILARVSYSTNEILVVIVTNGNLLPGKNRIVASICSEIENLAGIVQNINSDRGNVILGKKDIELWGKPYLTEKVGGYKFHISPRSFLQVNPVQTEVLYGLIAEYAELTGKETVFDLYSGIGTIAINVSKKAKKVVGVESIQCAVNDARENAVINSIDNAEFHYGAAERVMPQFVNKKGYRADVVIVDPPRKGCDKKLLNSILRASPARIIYVSCNPATLARDLKCLSGKYNVSAVQPVDMFPHTAHIETVVLLQRK